MTGAAYLTGVKSIDEEHVNEVIDQFVSQVLATTNVMWAAANFHDVNMSEDIGIVANNLHYEALYLRIPSHLKRPRQLGIIQQLQ